MAGFTNLRAANNERQKEWGVGIDAGTLFRATELGGEVGEALNEVKKLERERLGIQGSRSSVEKLAEELADVIICTDLVAKDYGINLAEAVRDKFNKTSKKVGLQTRMVAGIHGII